MWGALPSSIIWLPQGWFIGKEIDGGRDRGRTLHHTKEADRFVPAIFSAASSTNDNSFGVVAFLMFLHLLVLFSRSVYTQHPTEHFITLKSHILLVNCFNVT